MSNESLEPIDPGAYPSPLQRALRMTLVFAGPGVLGLMLLSAILLVVLLILSQVKMHAL